MTMASTVLGAVLVGTTPGAPATQLQQYDLADLPVEIATIEARIQEPDTTVRDYLDLPVDSDMAEQGDVEDTAEFRYVY